MKEHCKSCHHFRATRGLCTLRLLADTDSGVDPEQEKCNEYEEQVDYPWQVGDKLTGEGEVE